MRMYQSAYVDNTDPLVMFGPKMSTPREAPTPKEEGPKHDWTCAMPSDLMSPIWLSKSNKDRILTVGIIGILTQLAKQSPTSIWCEVSPEAKQAVSTMKYTLGKLFHEWTYDELVAARLVAKDMADGEISRMLKYAINYHVNSHESSWRSARPFGREDPAHR